MNKKETKIGYIYVFTTGISGVYKISRTKPEIVNDVEILYQIETPCPLIVENSFMKY
jgi:hypothetical protein